MSKASTAVTGRLLSIPHWSFPPDRHSHSNSCLDQPRKAIQSIGRRCRTSQATLPRSPSPAGSSTPAKPDRHLPATMSVAVARDLTIRTGQIAHSTAVKLRGRNALRLFSQCTYLDPGVQVWIFLEGSDDLAEWRTVPLAVSPFQTVDSAPSQGTSITAATSIEPLRMRYVRLRFEPMVISGSPSKALVSAIVTLRFL